MTGSVQDIVELDERALGQPVGGGGFTPEGPPEELVSTPAGPPGPFAPDGPISRSDVLTRSKSWVAEKVPYSQTSKHSNAFGSYRADCSGFVSMCWHLSASLTTFSLPDVSDVIPKADLRPGDVLWRRSAGEGHVALFIGWSNSARTRPTVREEFNFGEVAEERTWTRDYTSIFTARRYKRITDDGPAAVALAAALTDGMLVQRAGSPVAVLAGSARIALANRDEMTAIGAAGKPVRALSPKQWSDLPSVPDDGTLVSGAPGLPAALVVGGARVNLRNAEEITESGHGGKPVHKIPARAFRAMATQIEDGTLVSAAGLPVALIVGGARVNLRDAAEIAATGHSGDPVRRLPARVFTGLPSRIADGTLLGAAGLPAAVVVGGARVNFRDADEIAETGHANKPVQKVPARVLQSLAGPIADGTLIGAPGLPAAVIVGGARVNLRDAAEITATGHGGQPVLRIPARVFTGLPTDIADGTLLRTPESATVWRVAGGKRTKVAGGVAQLVPSRVLDGIPIQG